MANNSGWISLHRQIQNHWIWKDPNKFKWWIDILLTVNTSDQKVNIGFDVYDCLRGESLLSIQSWATRWNISKDTARNFLKLLEKENMIKCVSIGKSTRLTVCNYDSYQSDLHVKQTRSKREANATPTQYNKEDNDNNITLPNGNVVGFPPSTATAGSISYAEKCRLFVESFNKIKVVNGVNGKYQVTSSVTTKLKPRLQKYNTKQIFTALKNSLKDPYHIEQNFSYITPEYILRENIIERYLQYIPPAKKEEFIITGPSPVNHDDR